MIGKVASRVDHGNSRIVDISWVRGYQSRSSGYISGSEEFPLPKVLGIVKEAVGWVATDHGYAKNSGLFLGFEGSKACRCCILLLGGGVSGAWF